MKRSVLLCAALAACAFYAARPQQPPEAPFGRVEEIVAELSRISGLKQLRRIDCDRIGREGVKGFIERRVKEEVKDEEVRAEEITLKKFGFVPRDFDLKRTAIDMLSEQAAAFYDYRKKKLYVVDAMPDELQEPALVHELAHALADQHFRLEKFIGDDDGDDGSLARLAVMEGQATWLMSEYMARRAGRSIEDSPAILEGMAKATEAASGEHPVFAKAPLYLRETLLFPYSQGLVFQQAVVKKMGRAAFAEVFRNPPLTTQQVLHPERYFAGARPRKPELARVARGRRVVAEGEFGELDAAILLRQYAGRDAAARIAPEWRGGVYRVTENKAGRAVLEWATEWAGPEAAQRFAAAYRKVLEGKWKELAIDSEDVGEITGRGDDGHFAMRVAGARVSAIEGMERPAASGIAIN